MRVLLDTHGFLMHPLATACLLLAALALPARAGILLEAEFRGVPVRAEQGIDPTRLRVEVAGRPYLVEPAAGAITRLDATPPERLPSPPAPAAGSPMSLEQWSEGPLVAGYGTTYHVLIKDEQLCAEVLSSPWMTGFTDPLARSLALLERVDPRLAARPSDRCGPIPFTAYLADGFPLLVGYKERPLFRVTRLRFDHQPTDPLLAPPSSPATGQP